MAAFESLAIFLRVSYSSNPPLLVSPATSKLSFPTCTTKLAHKSHSYPLSISTKFQLFSSSPSAEAIQEEEETEKSKDEILQRRLFVLNLPWSFTIDDLKKLFGECGTVQDAQIITRKKDGKSRGYAFATMASREEALSVIEKFDSHELTGRIIRVEFAKDIKKSAPPPPPTPNEKRYKLYVSNLAWRVRANHLRDFFADLNPTSTRVVFESPEGRSAGYGFVTFASQQEAQSAISTMNGKELLGRAVTLAFSERDADKTQTEDKKEAVETEDKEEAAELS